MRDVHESVTSGHLLCPLLNLWIDEFDRPMTLSAPQVVMMFDLTTHAVARNVVLVPDYIYLPGLDEVFERTVDSGEAGLRARFLEKRVKFLSRQERVCLFEGSDGVGPLLGY